MLTTNCVGTVVEVQSTKALVKVDVCGRVSDWMPVLMMANAFKRHFIPLRVGEQVAVLGGLDNGFVLRGMYHATCGEPAGSGAACEVIVYESGASIIVDTDANTATLSGFAHVTVIGDATIDGNLLVTGTITDSVGLLTDHDHSGVMAGGARTGGR